MGPSTSPWSRRPYRSTKLLALAFVVATVPSGTAAACDICAVYIATDVAESRTGPRLGLFEQYSHYGTRQFDGEEVPNPGERLDSSITQLLFGWQVTPRVGVQIGLPLIVRDFRRLEDGQLTDGDESGVGDLTLVAHGLAWSTMTSDALFRFSLLGGLKLPTGNPDRLAEELAEPVPAAARRRSPAGARHSTDPPAGGNGGAADLDHESAIHGHDLALGSGSVDAIVGASMYWDWKRIFVSAGLQYAIRTEGSFDYRYANDLTWTGGPGAYALLTHDYTLGLQAVFSGETKGNDSQAGHQLDDTAITALYLGPGVDFTWGTSLTAEIAADLPVVQHNTSLQIVPDFRIRGGLQWRF